MGKIAGWAEQWERVLRWNERIKDQNRDRLHYEDDLWGFFMNCWHMKDWIENDPALGFDAKKKKHFEDNQVNRSEVLVICGDLANRTKHQCLDIKKRKTTKNADMPGRAYHVHIHDHVVIGGQGEKQKTRVRQRWDYRITYDNGKEEKALLLAKKAIEAWRGVFEALGLKVSS